MMFKNLLKATCVAALCGVAAFAGCSTFEEENTGAAQQMICAVDTPCTPSQSCVLNDGTNLTCIGGVLANNPDVCGLGNACTNPDSWCCAGPTGADSFNCSESGLYSLIQAGDPKCTCATDVDGDGYTLCENDCDDAVAAINPGATEICDLVDNNCDGNIDEGVKLSFCADVDLDTYGNTNSRTDACTPPSGYVVDCTDCNDANAAVNPGATEVCNQGTPIDDNCNGLMESSKPCDVPVLADLFCPNDLCSVGLACADPDETCYDEEAASCGTPAWLRCCGGVQVVDAGACALTDADGDTYASNVDCNDANAAVHPGAAEVCNGIDDNCDTVIDEGNPGGGASCLSGLPGECSPGTEMCLNGGILCVQNTASLPETCDGLDNDCDGTADDGNPGGGAPCSTGLLGVCAAGTDTCQSGSIVCVQNTASSAEICDGLDNDCNGVNDNGCLHAVRFVWTPPAGYVQTTANVLAIGDMWGVNVPGGYESHWHNGASVPSFCTMVQNSTFYECTVNIPGGGTSVCTNAFHEDAGCGGSSFGIAAGGYMFDQNDHACGNCIGLGNACASPTEFGSWDVYVDGVLQPMTTTPNGQLNTYNECLSNPIP